MRVGMRMCVCVEYMYVQARQERNDMIWHGRGILGGAAPGQRVGNNHSCAETSPGETHGRYDDDRSGR